MKTEHRWILGISVVANLLLIGFLLTRGGGDENGPVDGGDTPEATTVVVVTGEPAPPETVVETVVVTVVEPGPTVVATPTPEAVTPTAAATATPAPTATPEPTPTTAVAGPDWLMYTNLLRAEAGLPPVNENLDWSAGSAAHSQYMVLNDDITHSRSTTEAGQLAARYGNIWASNQMQADYVWALDYWVTAPFHAVPLLDPALQTVGYGIYREAVGGITVAATMDVRRGLGDIPDDITFPVLFPRDGGRMWVVSRALYERPEPWVGCPGLAEPIQRTGPPIIAMIGPGDVTPNVTGHSLTLDGAPVAHCIFDETSYTHFDEAQRITGRTILNDRDAIVIMPLQTLERGKTYEVMLQVNGQTIAWSFETVERPE